MIAIVEKDKVTLACTTTVFYTNTFICNDNQNAENAFCWKIPNDSGIIVGVSGTLFAADIFRYDSELASGELTRENLEKNTIPKIQSVLLQFGKVNEDGRSTNRFFFAQGNRCFEIDRYFCCIEIQGAYNTEAEDSPVAAYHAHHKDKSVKECLKKGYALSGKYFFGSKFPIAFIDTKSKIVKYISKAT